MGELTVGNRPEGLSALRPGVRAVSPGPRVEARGKFLWRGTEKLYVRGVTYGTFRDGLPSREVVAQDFTAMASVGINAVRVYEVPPRWLLDLAQDHGLHVMVGLPWEQHVAFLDDPRRADAIVTRVREGVRACAGHPAVLSYAIGNEIPASIVRWHGRRRVEAFLERLYRAAKAEDPEALVTYVSFPTTEYLDLPFVDFVCFNVYLEEEELLGKYIARLQNLAGDRPLVMGELGLDSARNGEVAQAQALNWQIRTSYAAGCAGTFVFAWTDEWHRGGHDVDDWDFGLVDRAREPKPALEAVRQAFAEVPFRRDVDWPRITVAVCVYNEAETLRECLDAIVALDYPDFETIVVDDGSTDASAAIAEQYAVRLISTPNEGLARARNRALHAATGEIVAYIDGDAAPDPDWLRYLAATFMTTPHAGVGGPNIAPREASFVARCVARAPGGPTHVLIGDREAEHIPGCNMAFRRDALEAIDGFDPQFRAAGDDVDVCWRLQERGWTLGFSPAALVWHHRRDTVRAYLKQQRGYGKAEAMLERKWPEKYNRAGHTSWEGRLYGGARRGNRWRVYYGTWGSSPFQSLYERAPGTLATLPLMPEWYLLLAVFGAMTVYGFAWEPVLFEMPWLGIPVGCVLLAAAAAIPLVHAVHGAWSNTARPRSLRAIAVTSMLFAAQPVVRLWGRLREGLSPWRRRGGSRPSVPRTRTGWVWSEDWQPLERWLADTEGRVRLHTTGLRRGGEFDRWDLQVRTGPLAGARLRVALEEHGGGKQLLRYRVWPFVSPLAAAATGAVALLAAFAATRGAVGAFVALGAVAAVVLARMLHELTVAVPVLERAVISGEERPAGLDAILRERAHAAAVARLAEAEE